MAANGQEQTLRTGQLLQSLSAAGYAMVGAGILIVLVIALACLMGWDGEYTPLMIIGLALAVVLGSSLEFPE
jgi:hypothetical protein